MPAAAFDLHGKAAIIVTMHGKAEVIEPALAGLGLRFLASPRIDTDLYGTFTRDVGRAGSQRDAVLAKAQAGLDLMPEADYALASEGAFGPHPYIPFVPSGLEMVAILERESGKAVIGHRLADRTNFMQIEALSLQEAEAFAGRIGFPDHAMVVMKDMAGPVIAKGLREWAELRSICGAHIDASGSVWLEADMRAHVNPTRMKAIAAAAADLARRLRALCPACGYPDWIPKTREGRPCAWCGGPTLEAWMEEHGCEECGHRVAHCIDPERKGRPSHCGYCNP